MSIARFRAVAHRASASSRSGRCSALSAALALMCSASVVFVASGCGNPRSAEAAPEPPKPAPIQDVTWSSKAREAYFNELVGLRYGNASPGDVTTRAWPIQWPFEGFAPEPTWLESTPLRAPIASVEWRFAEGTLVETYVDGDPTLLRFALAARPQASSATSPNTTPPANANWTWPTAFASAWTAEDDLNRSNTRWLWCDAFADVYEIAPGGPYLLAVDQPGGKIETSLVWPDASGANDPRAAITWPSLDASGKQTHRAPRGSASVIASADFDANGSSDFLHLTGTPLGASLGISYRGILVLTDAKTRRAYVVELATNGIGFIDIDQNNRSEMMLAREGVHVPKCDDGFPHDFTVTDLIGFQRMAPVDLAGVDRVRKGSFTGTFPAWRVVDGDPTQAFRPLLSGNLKRELHASGFAPYKQSSKRR
jgi:hypothetical protein